MALKVPSYTNHSVISGKQNPLEHLSTNFPPLRNGLHRPGRPFPTGLDPREREKSFQHPGASKREVGERTASLSMIRAGFPGLSPSREVLVLVPWAPSHHLPLAPEWSLAAELPPAWEQGLSSGTQQQLRPVLLQPGLHQPPARVLLVPGGDWREQVRNSPELAGGFLEAALGPSIQEGAGWSMFRKGNRAWRKEGSEGIFLLCTAP